MLAGPLVFQGAGRVYLSIYLGQVQDNFFFIACSCSFQEILLCLALIVETKTPHDFYSMDLNLEKHYVICKLFLNRTKLLRSAGTGGSVLEIEEQLRC